MKSVILPFLFVFVSSLLQAQELNCQVTVVPDAKLEVTTVEQEIFEQIRQTIFELMNNTKWTKDKYEIEERINCNIALRISDIQGSGNYICQMQVQSTRPAFNSNYNTTVFNYNDENVQFSFKRNSMLIYAQNQYRDNLTSICAFYAYFILGMDYDSFSLKGGTPHFQEAQNIVSLAQSAPGSGWRSNEGNRRNRYWLADNINRQSFEALRECNYEYHRLGVDKLYDDLPAARKNIYKALTKLNRIVAMNPNSINLQNFTQAKTSELINLFEDAEQKEKTDLINLMNRLDPINSSKYEENLR